MEAKTPQHKRDIPNDAFTQLPDETKVWRYLTLPKFLSLVVTRKLPLARADTLGDAFEGSVPKGFRDQLLETFVNDILAKVSKIEGTTLKEPFRTPALASAKRQAEWHIKIRRLAYVRGSHISCWRWGDESEAMWRLYCGPEAGVAIVTTYGKLKESLKPEPAARLGKVQYIDFAKESFPNLNFMHPLMHKRAAFAHEQEVRIVRFREKEINELTVPEPKKLPDPILFVNPWEPETVLESVVVSPYATDWYFETVKSVLVEINPTLEKQLAWSELRADPVY